jgi:hypothetical protein
MTITGTIDVTWRDNGNFTMDQQGVTSVTSTSPWSQYTTRSSGHTSEASADVSGTLLGYQVASWGDVSTSRDNNVTKEMWKGPQPPPPPMS